MSKPQFKQPEALPKNRIKVDFEAFFKPTWKQRIKLALGWCIVTKSYVFIDRRSEEVRAGTIFGTTQNLTPEDQKRNHAVNNMPKGGLDE